MAEAASAETGTDSLLRGGTETADKPGGLTAGNWAGAVLVALLLVVVTPALLLPPANSGSSRLALGLATAIGIYSGVRLGLLFGSGEARALSFTFWTFVYVFFALAPAIQLRANHFFLPAQFLNRRPPHEAQWQALALIIFGLVCYEIGSRRGSRPSSRRPNRPPKGPPAVLDDRRLKALAWVGLAVCLVTLGLLGGPAAILGSRRGVYSALSGFTGGQTPVISFLFVTLRFPVAAALLLVIRRVAAERLHPGIMERFPRRLLFLLVLANLLVSNPRSTPRFFVGTILLGVFFAYLAGRRPASTRWVMALTLVTLIVAFPYADAYRRSDAATIRVTSIADQFLNKGDYSMYTQVQHGFEYVQLDGHTLGHQAMGTALFFVPRDFWPQKPGDTGDTVYYRLGYPTQLNVSSPLWMEAYVEGGWPLVAAVLYGYGFWSRRIEDRALAEAYGPVTRMAGLLPLLAGYQIFLLRGSLVSALPRLLVLVALTAWCFTRLPDEASSSTNAV